MKHHQIEYFPFEQEFSKEYQVLSGKNEWNASEAGTLIFVVQQVVRADFDNTRMK